MDFNRGSQPFRSAPNTPAPTGAAKDTTKKSKIAIKHDSITKFGGLALLFGTALIILGVIALLALPGKDGLQFVNKDGYQAVDVATGGTSGDQVYFGKIAKVTDSYIVLTNVFYPVTNNSSGNVTTLVPFVCSLATPQDQLVLSRSQVAYWYNLQDSSKVASTIKEFKDKNDNKANCEELNAGTTTGSENPAGSSEEAQNTNEQSQNTDQQNSTTTQP